MAEIIRFPKQREAVGPVSDTSLIAACAAGDMRALGTLFYRYQSDLYGFLSRVSGTDDAELDDLVQNTFLQIQKSAGRFQGRSSVRSWMFAVAANVAKRYVRSSVRRKAAFRAFREVADTALDPGGIHETIDRKAMLVELETALGELSYALRVVFVMCDVEGIPGVEAARTLGIREGTLWRRLHDARKQLAARLERRTRHDP